MMGLDGIRTDPGAAVLECLDSFAAHDCHAAYYCELMHAIAMQTCLG